MRAYDEALAQAFAGTAPGVAEENVQARIRGNLLMALSNKFGWLVLTTGNKSEYSVGYTTLYGDMAGGFGVLKDVPKTWVYRLAHFRNAASAPEPIPKTIIARPPSAELKPGQTDQDTLPTTSGHGPEARRETRAASRCAPWPCRESWTGC
jgi:NAD+ synthetase